MVDIKAHLFYLKVISFYSSLNPDGATILKTMLANHGPLQKPRPNPLTMPPKRPGFDTGLGTPPIGSSQVFVVLWLFKATVTHKRIPISWSDFTPL